MNDKIEHARACAAHFIPRPSSLSLRFLLRQTAFPVNSSHNLSRFRTVAARQIRHLLKMFTRPTLQPLRGLRGLCGSAVLATGTVLAIGCLSTPPPAMEPMAHREAMFPSLQAQRRSGEVVETLERSRLDAGTSRVSQRRHRRKPGDSPPHPRLPLANSRRFHPGLLRQDLRPGQVGLGRFYRRAVQRDAEPRAHHAQFRFRRPARTIWPYRSRFARNAARRSARSRASFNSTRSCTSWPASAT